MHLRERSATSCEWFVNLRAYRKWVDGAESPLLWLKGRAGAGKSTLCSAILENLEKHQEQRSVIAFCFFESPQVQASSARFILRAFAYQLRDYMTPGIPERRLYSIIREGDDTADPMSLDEFQSRLCGILTTVDRQAQAFFVLDGLDSDKEIQKAISHEVLRSNRSRVYPNIFRCVMSSRFAFEATMSPEDVVQIDLSTEPGVQRDMLNFATTRLAGFFRAAPRQKVSVSTLAKKLCSRANGLFLWLALAIEDIQRVGTRPDMLRIDLLPANVDAFYRVALDQIASQDVRTAQKIFSWLTVATRPLYLSELLMALAVKDDHPQLSGQPLSTSNELGLPNTQVDIHRICGWLVTVTEEGIVRLRHSTLRDCLLFADESSQGSRRPVHAAHELLAQACLALLGSVIRLDTCSALSNMKASQQFGLEMTATLTAYAITNWYIHYRLSETHSRILAGTLQRCLIVTLEYDCQSFSIPNSGRSVQIANTTLRISAFYGLISLTRLCLDMGTDAKGGSCKLCETPHAIAVRAGHSDIASILLRGSARPASTTTYGPDEMIQLAVARGLTDAVESLLKRGTKVDAVELHSGKTLLHLAVESGRLDLVKLLMSYNANVNATIPKTQESPLHLAAAHGHAHIVKYLVDGRDLSRKELELYNSIVHQPYYQSWVEYLLTNEGKARRAIWEVEARDSAEEHIALLLSSSTRFPNVDLRTSGGRTALDFAASNGDIDIVRFLLERGAEFKHQESGKFTALQAAAENGHLETVELLLTLGANVLHDTNDLADSLEHAWEQGHHDVVDLVIWCYYNSEFPAKKLPWSVKCLPTKTSNRVARDIVQKNIR